MSHTTIGREIYKYRKERNMTIEELAKKSHVSAPTICAYENGKSLPKLRLLYKIAVALDCDYEHLVSILMNEKN